MGKASTSKKIQRVQRAGAAGKPGVKRNLGFPITIAVIIIAGSLLAFYARERRISTADEAPQSTDHWHAAFGIFVCDSYIADLADGPTDVSGIHTHNDGIIHIHPFSTAAEGANATLSVFVDQVGLTLEDDRVVLPDGTEHSEGDDCGEGDSAEPAQLSVYLWPPQATETTEPQIFSRDLGDLRFTADGQAIAIVFAPEGTEIPTPPALENIEELGAADAGPQPNEGSIPVDTIPTDTIPTESVPTESVPTESVPTETVPEGTETTVAETTTSLG